MQKILTVIIPIYNTQEFLPKCLDSLLIREDLMPLVEVLLIIDGSPDNALAVAQDYEKKYPQTFVVINKENGGYGSVLQRGIQEAKGKYCKVLDSDDWYDTTDFQKLIETLQERNEDIILTDYVREYVFENRQEEFIAHHLTNGKTYDLENNISEIGGDTFLMHKLTYKTDIVRKADITFPTKISYTDTLFASIPAFFAKDMLYLDLKLYRYFIGRDGQTVAPESVRKNRKHTEKVIRVYYENYLKYKHILSKEKNKYFLNSLKSLIGVYFRLLHHLPFSDAKKELALWNDFIKNTPDNKFFTDSKMWRYYNLLPYRVFRYTSFVWNK